MDNDKNRSQLYTNSFTVGVFRVVHTAAHSCPIVLLPRSRVMATNKRDTANSVGRLSIPYNQYTYCVLPIDPSQASHLGTAVDCNTDAHQRWVVHTVYKAGLYMLRMIHQVRYKFTNIYSETITKQANIHG